MSASIIAPLVISGSRKADGTANDSGRVWAYLPNTSTSATLYSNAEATAVATQPIVLDEGGRVSAADCPDGLFTAIPIRLYVEDSAANVVSDSVFVPATAATVTVDNGAFPSAEVVDDVLTQLGTSLGGDDGMFLESAGGVERTIHDKFTEIWVSVKDFGATGQVSQIATTYIQQAVNRVKALGGGVVYFPPGTYTLDQAITLSATAGVSFVGAGIHATIISCTNATANCFTFSTCTDFAIRGMEIVHTGASTGNVIVLTTCQRVLIDSVSAGGGGFAIGVDASAGNDIIIQNSYLYGVAGGATGRGLRTTAPRTISIGNFVRATGGAAIEFAGAARDGVVTANDFGSTATSPTGILFNASLTGTRFAIFGNQTLGIQTTPIDVSGVTIWPGIRQWGNGVTPTALSFATGTAQTPVIKLGNEIRLTASSGGVGVVTVNAPAVLPSGVDADDLYYDFVFKNAAGGAVTWTMNAIYVLDAATAIPTTAAHTIQLRFRWDSTTTKLRECARADTLT